MTITLRTLTVSDLAKLLDKRVSTIKSDARRNPDKLPPRFRAPGSTRLLWLEADVIEWVKSIQEQRT